jgi:hypothetical protein
VFGALILLLAGPWSPKIVSPGNLAAAHQGIDTPAGSCVACHTAAGRQGVAWIGSVFARADRVAESDKCLQCHFQQTTPEQRVDLLQAHGASGREVNGHRETDRTNLALGLASLAGQTPQAPIGCAVCHHEHRGANHDLTRMNDTSCQVCHETQFASFSRGHPQFRGRQQTGAGIAFDHEKHRDRFETGAFDCLRCHASDPTGTTMVLLPYESSCTGCHTSTSDDHHGDQIRQLRNSPMTFLRLHAIMPEGDVYWPDDEFPTDEETDTLMLLLLSGDPDVLGALEELDEAEVPEYLEEPGNKEALVIATWALIGEMLCGDLRPRLARALGIDRGSPAIEELGRQMALAAPAVLRMQQRWLPDLDVDTDCVRMPTDATAQDDQSTGWRHDPDQFTVNYAVPGHADPLAVAWLNALAEQPIDAPANDLRERAIAALEFSLSACLQCHKSAPDAAGLGDLPWRARIRETSAIGAHRPFVHRTHRNELGPTEQACGRCHKPDGHGFAAYDQADCASCHRPGRANDSCLTCHYYHVTRP